MNYPYGFSGINLIAPIVTFFVTIQNVLQTRIFTLSTPI